MKVHHKKKNDANQEPFLDLFAIKEVTIPDLQVQLKNPLPWFNDLL